MDVMTGKLFRCDCKDGVHKLEVFIDDVEGDGLAFRLVRKNDNDGEQTEVGIISATETRKFMQWLNNKPDLQLCLPEGSLKTLHKIAWTPNKNGQAIYNFGDGERGVLRRLCSVLKTV